MLLEISEISQRLLADTENLLHVNRIDSALSRFERHMTEFDIFMEIYEIRREHDIGQIVIAGHLIDVFGYEFALHQSERGIGIRHFHAECHAQDEEQRFFDETARGAVLPIGTVTNNRIMRHSGVPKSIEFLRIRLAIGIGLENPICPVLNCVAVSEENGRAVAAVWLIEGNEERQVL